jgi:hypothetical protein
LRGRKYFFEGNEHSDDEGVRAGYNSGTDDERSNDAFANLRARSTSPIHTTTALKDAEHLTTGDDKRTRNVMSDTDTSGDEDQFMDDEVHEVIKKKKKMKLICIRF